MAKKNYLIAGTPGSGKSTIGKALENKGLLTIDTDAYPGMSNWVNKITGKKTNSPSEGMDNDWFENYDYDWDINVLSKLLKNDDDKLYFYGSSSNQGELLDKFDKVFLLKVNPDLIQDRLKSRIGTSHYGKTESERLHVLTWFDDFQNGYIESGVETIDASKPIDSILQTIINATEH